MFAIFIECLICEMHLKFPLKLSNALLKVFHKLLCNRPVTEFLGFGFIGGHLYVNFSNHGLHKLQKNPYKLILTTTKEQQKFSLTSMQSRFCNPAETIVVGCIGIMCIFRLEGRRENNMRRDDLRIR